MSGWARLWIVGAVIVWSIGAWWLTNNMPQRPGLHNASAECYAYRNTDGYYLGGGYVEPQCSFPREQCMRMFDECMTRTSTPEMIAQERQQSKDARRAYNVELALKAAGVAIAPIVLGIAIALLLGVGNWVRRGFRQ